MADLEAITRGSEKGEYVRREPLGAEGRLVIPEDRCAAALAHQVSEAGADLPVLKP